MKSAKKIIVANWKMNPLTREEVDAITKGSLAKAKAFKKIQMILCPPALFTQYIKAKIKKSNNVTMGAQNIAVEPQGSYTGEIGAPMFADLGITHTVIGHSERRKMGETDDMVNKKVTIALKNKLIPIICIGETVRDEEGAYLGTIKNQIAKALAGVKKESLPRLVIAYEPVWAIGATSAMEPHDVHQMTIFIKKSLIEIYKTREMLPVPILYGGSVDQTNAENLIKEGEVDGFILGRPSLNPDVLGEIMKAANTL